MVVVLPPECYLSPSFVDIPEPMLIQAAIAELTIEAFNEVVLNWFTGLNEIQLHAVILGPKEHCLTGKFCPIVRWE